MSLNLYTYCRNNPLRYVDPSGHSYATLPDGSTMTINSAWDAEKFEEKKASMKKGAPGCRYGECSVSVSLEYQSTDLTDDMKMANAQVIKNYFSDKGWSLEATCAVLGNIEHESRLNPNAWQDYYFDDRYNDDCGYGLCQFTSAKDFLPKIGYNVETIDDYAIKNPGNLMIMQLDYIIESSQPGNGIFYPDYGAYGSNYNMAFDEFTHSTLDVKELALVFHGHYERSNDTNSGYENRQKCAQYWYDHFLNQ